jgi:uncharacterized protein with HEPN domain
MRLESRKYLHDILQACEAIGQFVEGKRFADYNHDLLLRSAVERQRMIVGEAMSQATRTDQELIDQIEEAREIINLRNVIVHGYTVVQNETVWGIVQADVPKLRDMVAELLA